MFIVSRISGWMVESCSLHDCYCCGYHLLWDHPLVGSGEPAVVTAFRVGVTEKGLGMISAIRASRFSVADAKSIPSKYLSSVPMLFSGEKEGSDMKVCQRRAIVEVLHWSCGPICSRQSLSWYGRSRLLPSSLGW